MIDKETQEQLIREEKIRDFVKSDAWNMIRDFMTSKLSLIESIENVETSNRPLEDIRLEIDGKRLTKYLILMWIAEVEGIADRYEHNKDLFMKNRGDQIIQNF